MFLNAWYTVSLQRENKLNKMVKGDHGGGLGTIIDVDEALVRPQIVAHNCFTLEAQYEFMRVPQVYNLASPFF